jgi:hypothetical protein
LAGQEQTKADRNVDKEETKANMQQIVAEMKDDRDAHVQEVVAKRVSAIEGKMEATVHSIRSERGEKIQRRTENVTERQEIPKEGAAVANLGREEQGHKELESRVDRQLVLAEEVARKSSRTNKRPRGRRISAISFHWS